MKIGVISNSFRVDFKESVKKAAAVGAQGIQTYATNGEFSVETLDTLQKRRDTLKYVKENGLVFSALCGDFGGHGFMNPDENPERIRRSKAILDLALDLECTVVTTHIGVVPADKSNPRYSVMQKACCELGEYGDRIGASFAIETGPESAEVLLEFIQSLGVNGVRVNLDPANLAMVCGEDSANAAKLLGPYTVHTHAKDGIMLVRENPEIIYGLLKHDSIEKIEYFREVVLGTGAVNFDKYLPALAAAGYNGFLTVEREVGQTPEKDIRIAVDFLKEKLARYHLA